MRRSRRELLSAVSGTLAMTLAGCGGGDGTDTESNSTTTSVGIDQHTTTASATSRATTTSTETTTEPDTTPRTTTVEPVLPGAWPQTQFDDAKTGFAPGHAGPGEDATIAWSVQREGRVNRSPTLRDGRLFVGIGTRLFALSAADGTEQWSVDLGDRVQTPATIAEGTVYVGVGGDVCARSVADGSEQWRHSMGETVWANPTVVDGTVYAAAISKYIGEYTGVLCALDASDGSERWRHETGGSIGYSSPAVVDGTVYVGTRYRGLDWARARGYTNETIEQLSPGGYVHACDAADGTLRWKYAVHDGETEVDVQHSPAVTDDCVVVLDSTGRIHTLAVDGTRQWRVETGANTTVSSPAVADDTVFATLSDGTVIALSLASGAERWRTTAKEGVDTQASPVVTDETVYLTTTDGSVRALDVVSGDRRWQIDTGGRLASGEPVVANGTVFVASRDELDDYEDSTRTSTVYAIRDDSS